MIGNVIYVETSILREEKSVIVAKRTKVNASLANIITENRETKVSLIKKIMMFNNLKCEDYKIIIGSKL